MLSETAPQPGPVGRGRRPGPDEQPRHHEGDMKEYFTAQELAGLPGMPGTDRRVRDKAQRENWQTQMRTGRGGGLEYHIESLPPETRKALAKALAASRPGVTSEAAKDGAEAGRKLALAARVEGETQLRQAEEVLKKALQLPQRERQRDADRSAILMDWAAYRKLSGEAVNPSLASYSALYNAGQRPGLEAVRQRIATVNPSTLAKWRRRVKQAGHLGARYGNREGDTKIDRQPEVRDFVLAMMTEFPHCKASQVIQGLEARFAARADVDLPSQGRLNAWMVTWKSRNAQLFCALANPDDWKDQYMTAFGSASEHVTVLNQLWEFDGTPADVMFTDGRHHICGVIDVYSRRPKMLITPTARGTAVAALLRNALLDWGLPAAPWRLTAKTDNGSDYTGHHMKRVFEMLDIEQVLCPPFSPWHKPHIERFFRTFAHDLVELLSGYIGHSVAERKRIEARKTFSERLFQKDAVVEINMSSDAFQRFCDDWVNDIYLHREHEGLNGKTPYQMVAEWQEPLERIRDERALDLLLAEAPGKGGIRTVGKKGIRLDYGLFVAPELWEHVRRDVRVLYDPADLGRIMVFGGESFSEFICTAECPHRLGIDRAEVAARSKEMQKKAMQQAKAESKANARKIGVDDIVNEIRATAAERANKLAALPRPSREYTSEGLQAASEAARSLTGAAAKARITADISTPEASYARWKKLEAKVNAGETLYAEDETFFRSFAQSADWRAMQKMEEDFGDFYSSFTTT